MPQQPSLRGHLSKLFTALQAPRLPDLEASARARASLYATIIRACAKCGAPGTYHNRKEEPRCYVAPSLPPDGATADEIDFWMSRQDGKPVGAICPNCGAERPPDENQGRIWQGILW